MKSALRSRPAADPIAPAIKTIRRPAANATVEEVPATPPNPHLVNGVAVGPRAGSRMIAREPEPATTEQPLAYACGSSSRRRGGK